MLSVFLIGSNALGGYVFARMAKNQGKPLHSLISIKTEPKIEP